ncbi:hypothetical protein M569_04701 [Genlisea aurea]|uniref:Ubiquitin thioesterase OTU n=1 Tax=Genlisea aurea TaxID=192259 RepID=S8E2Z4_9LAMI|nr:hypothetical protein M569_04701 [Genlisea aurea]
MLGVLCARSRTWLLPSLPPSYVHASAPAPFSRRFVRTLHYPFLIAGGDRREDQDRPLTCSTSLWHSILLSYWRRRRRTLAMNRRENFHVKGGEGSWNVAWDTRPARWLNHPDLAWLLFGVTDSVVSVGASAASNPAIAPNSDSDSAIDDGSKTDVPFNYRVKEVVADGKCLFRAIAHMACLINGENAPDVNRQGELADELRAQVVQELVKRRKEVEWTINEDFDVYVERIQKPYVWGGEPELLMASHVLR